jgi:hypothetical protein
MCLFTLAGVAGHWSWISGLRGELVLASPGIRIFCEEDLSDGALSRVCSIQGQDLAHGPLCLLSCRFQMGRLMKAVERLVASAPTPCGNLANHIAATLFMKI